jgi:hypothetical protein
MSGRLAIFRLFLIPAIVGVAVATNLSVHGAEMLYPLSAVADSSGSIFVADRDLPGIWKITGNVLSTYFKGEKKFRTPLNAVRCLALDYEGKLLAGDSATRDVYRFDGE